MLTRPFRFPSPQSADATGLVAVTSQLTPELLLSAYTQGIFPWADNPVQWYSPDPRAVFLPETLNLPSNLPKLIRRGSFHFTFDTAFACVVRHCAEAHRTQGVWITPRFIEAYVALHQQGHAHSIEVWQAQRLVGGLYGVQVGGLFAGESMFHRVANASKAAFWALLQVLNTQNICLLDAQVINDHTARLGAVQIRRTAYLQRLAAAIQVTSPGSGAPWPTLLSALAQKFLSRHGGP